MTLYQKIKELRTQKKISQEALAKMTGYTDRSSIAKIEQGKVDLSETKIQLFAKALNTTPAYLMGWEDEQNAQEEIDIENMVNDLMNNLNSNQALMYSGEPMDEVTKELVRASIEQAARIAMARHKERNDD